MNQTTNSGISPCRLLCITRAYGQNGGGMERLSYELIEQLKKQPKLEVTVIANETKPDISLLQARVRSVAFLITASIQALITARNYDVIHLGDPLLAKIGWLLGPIFRKPIAVTVHGLDIIYPNPLYQLYLKIFFTKLDQYFPISTHVASLLSVKLGIEDSKITVINPGLHDRFYDPQITRKNLIDFLSKNTEQTLPNNPTILFTAGRLVKRKGHAWFIKHVLPHLPSNTVYFIAGDGPEKRKIEDAANSAAPGKAILLGRLSDTDLRTLYNTVDAFIQPNIEVTGDLEGFGLVMLEAALCQRSVFAANLEGITDAIQDGQNGTLLPAADAPRWIHALRAHSLQPNPQTRTYTRQKFSWQQAARQYTNALTSLAKQRS